MMKNKMMRIASVLLVAVLFSTCAISGTFAKYVTTDSSADEARVAKWGVVITAANASSFKDAYSYDTNTEADKRGTLAVKADTEGTNLVAPGTADPTGITFSITGSPEVATKITIAMNTTSDVVVPKGTYTDGTSTDGGEFVILEAYNPVEFTLKQTKGKYAYKEDETIKYGDATAEKPFVAVNGGTLAEVKAVVEAASTVTAPNSTLDSTYVLTWEWKFEGNFEGYVKATEFETGKEYYTITGETATKAESLTEFAEGTTYYTKENVANMLDTLLGNVIANKVTNENIKTNLAYDITFTVTQVD